MEIRLNDRTAESQSHLVGAHSRIYTCRETKLHEYFHISIWSEHVEQTGFSTEVKERLNGNPECQSLWRKSSLFSRPAVRKTDIFASSPREDAFIFQSGVPPSTSRKANGQKYQLSDGNSKFQNFRVCLLWYKNPLSTCGIHLAPVASPHGELRQTEPTRVTLRGYKRSDFWCRDLTFLLQREREREINPDKLAC